MIEIFGDIRIDWLSKRRLFYGFSAVLLLVGLGSVLAKGSLRYGVDFQGGAVVYVRFADPVPVDQIRDLLRNSGAPDSQIQELGGSGDSGYDLLIQVEQSIVEEDLSAGRELITAALNDSFEGGFEILNSESVGPKVGADLRRKATI
jgi:preprotein translocase subunit SecF